MAITIASLAEQLNGTILGNHSMVVLGAQSLEKAQPEEISFVADEKYLKTLAESSAGAVIAPGMLAETFADELPCDAVILVDDPQAAFLQSLEMLRPRRPRTRIGLSRGATISPTALIDAETNIHPGAHVGDDVIIGSRCDIHPGVVVGNGCRLGDDVILYPNVVLYPDVVIGNRVTIHASAVLGADGFGYRLIDDRRQKLPHFGIVRIEDDVEIGSCTTIDRAMIGETVIGEGTKLDNLVMIAHNCEIGKHNAFVGQVGLAGSVTSGDYVVCAGQVGIADHVHLGEGCTLGSKSGVHKDIPAGQVYMGAPAQPVAEALKTLMAQRKLPEMLRVVRRLEKQVRDLTDQVDRLSGSDNQPSEAAA